MNSLYVIVITSIADERQRVGVPNSWQVGLPVRTCSPSEDGWVRDGFELSNVHKNGARQQFWTSRAEAQAMLDKHAPHVWGATFEVVEFARVRKAP